jgi:hypothetical protein
MEETEGRLALRTIIIVTKSILIETFLYMFLQLISMSLRRFASEAQKVGVMMAKPLKSTPAKVAV